MARRKIDKQSLASLIRESKELNNDQKADLLQLLNEQKRYGLVWEEHKEDAEELLTENIPILIEETSKRIISSPRGGQEGADHILIEGDNLHALTALTYTHEGKVDVIYIDPPYNTGNKDFVYNDSYVDSEDGYRHSKWLSFMEKRLRIAKKLLSDRGVIFISIDDNEQANLKLLCDEVFGSMNFISQFIWKKKQGGGNDSKNVVTEHEYVLVYSKNNDNVQIGLDKLYKPSDSLYPNHDEKGDYGLITLDKASIQFSQSLVYEIVGPDGTIYTPRIVNGKQSCWRWGREKVNRQYNELVFKNGKVYTKYYRPDGVTPRSLLIDAVYGRTESGKDDLAAIFEKVPFSYPKPVSLIKHCVTIGGNKDITILDFFAGSGTTLHATMQLNAEDGGHRQCILVTNNENNICEEVTYERNKRVINGYTTPKGVEVPGLSNNNLRYYKTAFVPREKTAANRHALMNMSTDLLCIKENMYNEQPFEIEGKKMKPEFVRYFVSDAKDMIIIYDPRAVAFVAKALPQDSQKKIMVYVYSDGQYAYNDEFHGKNIELCALPDAIYQALSRVLPPQKEVKLLNSSPRGGQEGAL